MATVLDDKFLGKHIDELDTPFLAVDLDAIEFNIDKMARACADHNIAWRPHSKCHKSGAVATRLVAAGAIGVTCAKISEAEVIARHGITDLLIANMIVGAKKVERLVQLRQVADPIVCIDHIDQARPIGAAMSAANTSMRVIIEVDIGLERVGVLHGQPTLELARQLAVLPGIELAGIMGYEGHLLRIDDPDEKVKQVHEALGFLVDTAELLRADGIPCRIVSCGGTGSYQISVAFPGITELQAGGGIFMDEFYRRQCKVEGHRHAMSIIATVVSRPAEDRVIIDAGRKTMSQDGDTPRVVGRDDVTVEALSAEHGLLRLQAGAQMWIGDRLQIIPGYSDLTAVLHNAFYCFRNERLEEIWPLEARGLLT